MQQVMIVSDMGCCGGAALGRRRAGRAFGGALALAVLACGCAVAGPRGMSAPVGASGTSDEPRADVAVSPGAPGAPVLIVPDVTGQPLEQARAAARAAGFQADLEVKIDLGCASPQRAVGLVECQHPEPGTRLSRGGWIEVSIYQPPQHNGMIMYRDARAAIGMTVAQARALLKRLGHDGPVTVGVVTRYDASCSLDRVCGLEHQGEVGTHDEIMLLLNPKLEIAPPP